MFFSPFNFLSIQKKRISKYLIFLLLSSVCTICKTTNFIHVSSVVIVVTFQTFFCLFESEKNKNVRFGQPIFLLSFASRVFPKRRLFVKSLWANMTPSKIAFTHVSSRWVLITLPSSCEPERYDFHNVVTGIASYWKNKSSNNLFLQWIQKWKTKEKKKIIKKLSVWFEGWGN